MVEEKTVTFWESSEWWTVLAYNPDAPEDGSVTCVSALPQACCGSSS